MRNLLVTIRFIGTNYAGSQIQKNAPTITGELGLALREILGARPDIKGVSRTDAGVHAEQYCFSFKTENPIPADGLLMALNALLPDDIGVISCKEVPETFHARYDCKAKQYTYRFLMSRLRDPFLEPFVCRYAGSLNVAAMADAAALFVGTHDFSAFRAAGSDTKGSVRTVLSADVKEREGLIEYTVKGTGFLYNMVRIMAGTLLEIGAGRRDAATITKALKSGKREDAGPTAPPKGLSLTGIFYE